MARARKTLLIIIAVVAAATVHIAREYVKPTWLVVHAAGMHGLVQTATAWQTHSIHEQTVTLATRHGALRGRLYRPDVPVRRSVVMVAGVHALGIDEPRMVSFARDLSAVGVAVVTPELPDLRQYRITPRTTDMIEDSAAWVATRADLAPDGRVGLVGISFGGGLSLVAAGRATVRDRIAYTLSFGGYGDLPRVLRFLCTGNLPDGRYRRPHDYGVVIILLNVMDRLVPAPQVPELRRGVLAFLFASHLAMFDTPAAEREFAHAKELETTLPEPSATLMHYVNTRDVTALGPRLLQHAQAFGSDPALSPERAPGTPVASVYLLHGADDNVIPAMETTRLADYLRSKVDVRSLITPLITHAEANRSAGALDVWGLINYWAAVLDE